jgi:hypothetical protein
MSCEVLESANALAPAFLREPAPEPRRTRPVVPSRSLVTRQRAPSPPPSPLPGRGLGAVVAGLWRRLRAALRHEPDRAIARFLEERGGRVTDATEREIERHFLWRDRL